MSILILNRKEWYL